MTTRAAVQSRVESADRLSPLPKSSLAASPSTSSITMDASILARLLDIARASAACVRGGEKWKRFEPVSGEKPDQTLEGHIEALFLEKTACFLLMKTSTRRVFECRAGRGRGLEETDD